MSSAVTKALLDFNSGSLYRRKDVMVMDTSSTSLPAASLTPPTVDSVVLQTGDRVLFTALTTGANKVYTLVRDSDSTGQLMYYFAASGSPHYSSDARLASGLPSLYDVLKVLKGTHADELQMWDGTSWAAQDMATAASVAAAVTAGTTPAFGTTVARPVSPATGYMYFDTTLGQPVWWDGSGWVDATGTTA